VLPYVFIGDSSAAANKNKMASDGITHIINCVSQKIENAFPDTFKYVDFEIEDSHNFDISQCFEPFYDVVKEVKDKGDTKVLVHCDTGQSISPTLLLAYMMMASQRIEKHLSLQAAYRRINDMNPGAIPNDNFMNQLIELEEQLFDEVSMRMKGSRRGGTSGGGGRRGKQPSGKPGARDIGTGAAAKARMKYQRGKGKRGK